MHEVYDIFCGSAQLENLPGQLHLKVVASRLPQGVFYIQSRGFVSALY
jgi:hypothetical protein